MIRAGGIRSSLGVVAFALGLLATMALGCVLAYTAGEWWLERKVPVVSPTDWTPRSPVKERGEGRLR